MAARPIPILELRHFDRNNVYYRINRKSRKKNEEGPAAGLAAAIPPAVPCAEPRQKRPAGVVPAGLGEAQNASLAALEHQVQRHLDETRAAGGSLNETGPLLRGRRIDIARLRAKAWIQFHVVAWGIEARMIEQVEELRIIFEREPFVDLEYFGYSEVEPCLEGSAKNVAPRISETVLYGVAEIRGSAADGRTTRRNRIAAARSGRQERNREGGGVEVRLCWIHACSTLELNLRNGFPRGDGKNRVRNEIVAGEVNGPNRSREVIDAKRLSCFCNSDSADSPSVENLVGKSGKTRHGGDLIEIADYENVRSVKARVAVTGPRVARIISIVEQLQAAALVQRVRIGVRGVNLQTVPHAFVDAELQCVIVRNSFSRIEVRIGVITDVGRAQRGVAVREREFSNGRLNLLRNQRISRVIERLHTIRVDLPIDGIGWRCHQRLIERNRQDFMNAVVADIGDCGYEIVSGLPLQVQTPVLGIGQCVPRVVTAEQEIEIGETRRSACWSNRLWATTELRLIVNQSGDARKIAWRRRGRGGSKRVVLQTLHAGAGG